MASEKNFTLRPGRREDAEAAARLWMQSAEEHTAHDRIYATASGAEQVMRRFLADLASSGHSFLFVAESGGRVVGFISGELREGSPPAALNNAALCLTWWSVALRRTFYCWHGRRRPSKVVYVPDTGSKERNCVQPRGPTADLRRSSSDGLGATGIAPTRSPGSGSSLSDCFALAELPVAELRFSSLADS